MHHILEALVRWLAPICSFTAEEIWAEMPGERKDTVMLATWYDKLASGDEGDRATIQRLRKVREVVGPWLEQLRRDKTIGASLAAEITLEASGKLAEELEAVGDELRFFFISSDVHLAPVAEPMETAEIDGDTLKLAVQPTEHAKCVRCWHHRDSVGKDDKHPELCGRCVINVEGPGETRRWG
jgi:isoleucyl-tRNA synthetase